MNACEFILRDGCYLGCSRFCRWQDRRTHTHTHPFNGPFSGTTRVSRYQRGKTSLDFTEARDSEWQWHQLGHMQVWTSLQTDNHASTAPLSFLQAGCPSCRPTKSVKALKARPTKYDANCSSGPLCNTVIRRLRRSRNQITGSGARDTWRLLDDNSISALLSLQPALYTPS